MVGSGQGWVARAGRGHARWMGWIVGRGCRRCWRIAHDHRLALDDGAGGGRETAGVEARLPESGLPESGLPETRVAERGRAGRHAKALANHPAQTPANRRQ
ncbi:hypothetical protein STHU_53170 [Allostella humosa]|nr:hypothetical protein STHU_53170 [Stella humosa]